MIFRILWMIFLLFLSTFARCGKSHPWSQKILKEFAYLPALKILRHFRKQKHFFQPSTRHLVKSAYQKIYLISQPKHMLWLLKRTVSMRQFFWVPNTYVNTDGQENIHSFTKKLIILLLNQNICCGYSKELSQIQWDGSFEHPKHMLKQMGEKIFTILR